MVEHQLVHVCFVLYNYLFFCTCARDFMVLCNYKINTVTVIELFEVCMLLMFKVIVKLRQLLQRYLVFFGCN